jgi:hypothetical protein
VHIDKTGGDHAAFRVYELRRLASAEVSDPGDHSVPDPYIRIEKRSAGAVAYSTALYDKIEHKNTSYRIHHIIKKTFRQKEYRIVCGKNTEDNSCVAGKAA